MCSSRPAFNIQSSHPTIASSRKAARGTSAIHHVPSVTIVILTEDGKGRVSGKIYLWARLMGASSKGTGEFPYALQGLLRIPNRHRKSTTRERRIVSVVRGGGVSALPA
jgi:hypothetical protein